MASTGQELLMEKGVGTQSGEFCRQFAVLALQVFVQGWAEFNPKYAQDLLKNMPPQATKSF